MNSSISVATHKQYDCALKRWWAYCKADGSNVLEYTVSKIIDFLTCEFNRGVSYGTLNSSRSALALLLSPNIGCDATIKRFLQGIQHLKPSTPKYEYTWEPQVVLDYLANLDNDKIPLDELAKKLAMLLALTTAHRIQTLSLINVNNIIKTRKAIEIRIPDRIKTSGKNTIQPTLVLPYFPQQPEVCVATTLAVYLKRTRALRPPDSIRLFITHKKPYRQVSSQTLGKWIKRVMGQSGIDTSIFTAHSTRHASTSAASRKGVSIDVIRATAGWSKHSNTFAKFYNKPLCHKYSFAEAILG